VSDVTNEVEARTDLACADDEPLSITMRCDNPDDELNAIAIMFQVMDTLKLDDPARARVGRYFVDRYS